MKPVAPAEWVASGATVKGFVRKGVIKLMEPVWSANPEVRVMLKEPVSSKPSAEEVEDPRSKTFPESPAKRSRVCGTFGGIGAVRVSI